MALDPQTLLLAMLLVVLLVAGGCLLIWLQERGQTALLWMAAAAAITGLAMIGHLVLPLPAGIAFTNSALLVAFGLIWSACRSLRDQPPRIPAILLPVSIWLGLCLSPGFRERLDLRIGLALLLLMAPILLAARELWLKRPASQIIRRPMLVFLGLQSLLMLQRAIRSLLHPEIMTLPFETVPGFAAMMLDFMVLMLVFSFSMIAFVKDRSVRWHHDAARSDFLTGVGNRLHFEESLDRHFHRARRSGQPLALIMIDADAFKQYNDLYGHPAGDRCLQALAEALVASCRPADVVGRYGGEEFAVLLPNADARIAATVAERMLLRVRSLRICHAGRPGGTVSVSLGIAALLPHSDLATPDDLVEAADRALYEAKQAGRDRFCLAPRQTPAPQAVPSEAVHGRPA